MSVGNIATKQLLYIDSLEMQEFYIKIVYTP